MTSIAAFRVGKVVKLDKAKPHSCQKLIPPDLITKVDYSTSNIIHQSVKKCFLLIDEVFVEVVSSNLQAKKPKKVDDVNNDDRVEFAKEVDICVEEVKSYRSILDNISHPLPLNTFAVNWQKEV